MEHVKEATTASSASSGRNDVTAEPTATSSENEQKTLHWLQSSLAEMKGEILDLNRSVNVSRQLQQQQETAGQLQLTRFDVTVLQAQVADEAAYRQQINQSIQQVDDDVQRLDHHQQLNAAQLERLENNVSYEISHLCPASHPPAVVCRTGTNEWTRPKASSPSFFFVGGFGCPPPPGFPTAQRY